MIELLSHHPDAFIACALILGLLVGSFINVLAWRLPQMLERDWQAQARSECWHAGQCERGCIKLYTGPWVGAGRSSSSQAWDCQSCASIIGRRHTSTLIKLPTNNPRISPQTMNASG